MLRTAAEVFGWVAAVVGVAAYGSVLVIGAYTTSPKNRNFGDVIVLLSIVFAVLAVVADGSSLPCVL